MPTDPSPVPHAVPRDSIEPPSPPSPTSMASVPTERIEADICQLAAHLDAARCRFLLLIAEHDRREAWMAWECRSAAHWLSWKCGLSLRAAREHVRVGRALETLPAVRRAFAAGELSYSKARAITRIAVPATDEMLVELARHATGADMDRICGRYREHGQEGAAAAAAQAYADRRLRTWYDDDGSLCFAGRVPADQAPIVLASLAAARDVLRRPLPDDPAPPADATPPAANGPAGPHDGDRRTAGDAASAGDDPASGRDGPAGPRRDPEPRCDGVLDGLSGVAAAGDSHAARSADALVLLAESFLASGAGRRSGGDRTTVNVVIDVETLAADQDGDSHLATGDGRSSPRHLAAEVARRLACDGTAIGHVMRDGDPLHVGRAQRLLNRRLRRAVALRDRGCRMPGCALGGFTDVHHVRHWAHGGRSDLPNLVTLCAKHHRAVHEGGWWITGDANGTLTFHRPDGRPAVVEAARIDRARPLERQHAALGLTIDATTNRSLWDARPYDTSTIIAGLDHLTRRARLAHRSCEPGPVGSGDAGG